MNSTQAIINLKNLQYNYQSIRRKTNTKVMAVVKADAYGHGMIQCVNALQTLSDKPEYYGVALLTEAIELRKSKLITEPILCFAPVNLEHLNLYKTYKIIPTVASIKNANELSKLSLKFKIRIHVNINTGMNRLGVKYDEANRWIQKLARNKNIIIDGIYTHFATSDEKNKNFAKMQLKRFNNIISDLKSKKINFGIIHAANSGAILDMPNSYFDMVRPGISLYGYYPSLETSESIKLKPVMSLVSRLSTVTNLNKNEYVGYGRKFKAKNNIKVGTIPIGYADGVLRGLSNKMKVIIGNELYDQIGRISMDRISISLRNKIIRSGSKVILLGKKGSIKIDAWDWSTNLNTIPYEITCTISKRVERKFIQ